MKGNKIVNCKTHDIFIIHYGFLYIATRRLPLTRKIYNHEGCILLHENLSIYKEVSGFK